MPVPSEADRDTARTKVASIFDVEEAKTADERMTLAKLLLATAPDTKDDPIEQFVLLNMAREIAADAGQIRLAFEAVTQLESLFDFDAAPVRMATFGMAVKAKVSHTQKREVVAVGIEMIDQLIDQDEHVTALKLVTPLLEISRKAGDKQSSDRLLERRKRALDLQSSYAAVTTAVATLEDDPDDAKANLTVGRYQAFIKGDWGTGLTLLAKGDSDPLAAAAIAELGSSEDAERPLTRAEAWWTAAQQETDDDVRRQMLNFALMAYVRAEPSLSGLDKVRAKKQVQGIAESIGLRAYWPFDEKQGALANDMATGQQNEVQGATWTDGISGGALKFDGKDDVVEVGTPEVLNFDGPITLCCWARLHRLPELGRVDESQMYLVSRAMKDKSLHLRLYRDASGISVLGGFWRPEKYEKAEARLEGQLLGTWFHFATTFDGKAWRMYRDGLPLAEDIGETGARRIDGPWLIGALPIWHTRRFCGDIDDVRIYSRALSAQEVASLCAVASSKLAQQTGSGVSSGKPVDGAH